MDEEIAWHERRYPDDFKDWKPVIGIRGDRYLILESPDKRHLCVVHRSDNEIAAVISRENFWSYGKPNFVYIHPKTKAGAESLFSFRR